MLHEIQPLPFDPAAIEADLARLDFAAPPLYIVNRLQREEPVAEARAGALARA
jgi:hypothetical protein